MKRVSVLQPAKNGSKNLMVRVPDDLYARLALLKDMAKERGLRLDIDDAVLRTVRSLLDRAESELGKLPSSIITSTTKPDTKTESKADKSETKKAAAGATASA
jgi:hypothetical protein